MSEADDWGDGVPPPRRKSPPKWMLLAGCGCIIPGFLLVAMVAWGMQFFGTATNPRLAYEALAEALPYDEGLKGRATGVLDDPNTRALESFEEPRFALLFGAEIPFSGGLAVFYFGRGVHFEDGHTRFDDDALIALVTKVPVGQSDSVLRGTTQAHDGRPMRVAVQGRNLTGLRFESLTSDVVMEFPRGTMKVTGPGVSLKLLDEVTNDPENEKAKLFDVLLTLQRPTESGAQVSDDDVRDFLAPFHVGPDR